MRRRDRFRRGHKRLNAGKALGIAHGIGEGLARFGSAIPLIGGPLSAVGNAVAMGTERGLRAKGFLDKIGARKRRRNKRPRPHGAPGVGHGRRRAHREVAQETDPTAVAEPDTGDAGDGGDEPESGGDEPGGDLPAAPPVAMGVKVAIGAAVLAVAALALKGR